MGAWGAGLFADDDAMDVRDRYRQLLGDGYDGEAATDVLVKEWNPDQGSTVFWLALAATQWRCGRLEDRVRRRALQIIDEGTDLDRWNKLGGESDKRKRAGVLLRLRSQLLSPQPAAKRVTKQYRSSCDWERGELIAYRLLSGNRVIFRVLGLESDRGGTWPVCEILDWVGESIPAESELQGLSIRQCASPKVLGRPQVAIGRASRKEYPDERITRLHMKLEPEQQAAMPHVFTLWRYLDSTLKRQFDLS